MHPPPTPEVRILTPNPILGYGYPAEHFWRGVIVHKAHAVIVDAGSTDGGPDDLALGKMIVSRASYERDREAAFARDELLG
jgi:hypothetical protein